MENISLASPGADFFSSPEAHGVLENEVLPLYVPQCRWFGGKARQPQRYVVDDLLKFTQEENGARLVLVRVEYAKGVAEVYVMPVRIGPSEGVREEATIATFNDGQALLDALEDADCRAALLRLIRLELHVPSESGELVGSRGSLLDAESDLETKSRYLKVEQSNSSIAYGEAIFLKLFRKPEDGINPDVEITRFLSERAHNEHTPPFAGAIEFHRPGAEPRVLGLAVGMVKNRGDAWAYALDEVTQFFGRLPGDRHAPNEEAVEQALGALGERIAQLARRTAEVHLALASDANDPVFKPEPITTGDQEELRDGVLSLAKEMFALLPQQHAEGHLQESIDELIALESAVEQLAGEIGSRRIAATKTRTHGDYHLGQVLNTGDDFVIIDFEGEPRRTLAERQAKRSPLRDVAGMLRSFHYAAHSALERLDPADRVDFEPWVELWAKVAQRIFLETWLQICAGASFLPHNRAEVDRVLCAFLLEKAIYEVMYELNHRPAWVGIPVRGVLHLLRGDAKPVEEGEIIASTS